MYYYQLILFPIFIICFHQGIAGMDICVMIMTEFDFLFNDRTNELLYCCPDNREPVQRHSYGHNSLEPRLRRSVRFCFVGAVFVFVRTGILFDFTNLGGCVIIQVIQGLLL